MFRFFLLISFLGLLALSAVRTPEDIENLKFFDEHFQKASQALHSNEFNIPKVIHLIWLGPEGYPVSSIKNLQQWVALYPEWKIKLWTDRERVLPIRKNIEVIDIQNFSFYKLEDLFYRSDNFGEKSELLRYEILFQEGGVYADHDVFVKQPLDPLHSYHFYCGLEEEGPSCLSTSIFPSPHLIGSQPHHPILEYAMDWLLEKWEALERYYPGSDPLLLFSRVKHRTTSALHEGIKNKRGDRDLICPSFYFSSPDKKRALYTTHLHAGTWFKKESEGERKIKERLKEIEKEENMAFKWLLASLALTLGLPAFLHLYKTRRVG